MYNGGSIRSGHRQITMLSTSDYLNDGKQSIFFQDRTINLYLLKTIKLNVDILLLFLCYAIISVLYCRVI